MKINKKTKVKVNTIFMIYPHELDGLIDSYKDSTLDIQFNVLGTINDKIKVNVSLVHFVDAFRLRVLKLYCKKNKNHCTLEVLK